MSRKINYTKSEQNGWYFTSEYDNDEPNVYFMSSGRYTTDPLKCRDRIKARFNIYNQRYICDTRNDCDLFFCKEDVEELIEDNKMYHVILFDYFKYDSYLSNRKSILSTLPSRDEAMTRFFDTFGFDEDEHKLFNELLVVNNNHLSLTCSKYLDIRGFFSVDSYLITYVPPISFKETKKY